MLKLLIVDDEPIILEGLQKTINWNECGFEIVGTAANGLEGLEKIRQLLPDAVITDVRMNFIDGLELIRRSKEFQDTIFFIVLSAYNDFDYAKVACDLGAFSYITKPFEEDQVMKVMRSLRDKIIQRKASEEKLEFMNRLLADQKTEVLQRIIKDIFKQQLSVKEINHKLMYITTDMSNERFYTVVIIRVNEIESLNSFDAVRDNEIAMNAVQRLITELLEKEFAIVNVYLDNGDVGLLIRFMSMRKEDDIRLNELLDRALKLTKEYLGISVSISKGSCLLGYEGIMKSYREACKALELSYIIGTNDFLDIKNTGISVDILFKYPYKIEYNLLNAIKTSDIRKFKAEFDSFVEFLKKESKCYAQISFSLQCLFVSIVKSFMETSSEWTEKYGDIEFLIAGMYKLSLEKIVLDITGFTEEFIKSNMNANYNAMNGYINDVIKLAVDYIIKNIADSSLTIKKVSEEVHMNQVYFGRLFKKELGVSFTEYVTQQRIDIAKKLLTERNFKVYEVAEKVGIDNLSYFNVLFKKSVGVTPVEFKNEAGKKYE